MPLLNAGNIVNLGFQVYRSQFKLYFRLALTAHLWLLVPIYGWAKYFATSALISRLVYREIIGSKETLKAAHYSINKRLYKIFFANILVGVILSTVALILLSGILVFLSWLYEKNLGLLVTYYFTNDPLGMLSTTIAIVSIILSCLIVFVTVGLWVYSRFSIFELPLALEDKVGVAKAVRRSWKLTKGSGFRIKLILTVAFLISLPLQICVPSCLQIWNLIVAHLSSNSSYLYILFVVGLFAVTNAFMMPFWQAIKAVLYYDIRNRREGVHWQPRNSMLARAVVREPREVRDRR